MNVFLQLLLLVSFLLIAFLIWRGRAAPLAPCSPCSPCYSDSSSLSPFSPPVSAGGQGGGTPSAGGYGSNAESADGTAPPVVIVGGGLTGLILAYELTKSNIPFVMLESQAHLGGRIATIRYPDGDTSEAPLEEYWQRSPTIKLLKELNIEMREDSAHSSVMIDGKITMGNGDPSPADYLTNMFPLPTDRAAFLQWNDKVWSLYLDIERYCLKPHSAPCSVYTPPPPHLAELMKISFAEFVRRSKLPRRVEEWIRITLEPEIATEWDTISALDGIDEMRIFLNTPDGFGESNYHLKKGNTEFIKQLVAKLPPHCIRLNSLVGAILAPQEKDKSGEARRFPIVTYLENHPADVKQIINLEASYVVVTIPLPELHHIRFAPLLDVQRRMALETCRVGSYIKVHLRLRREAEKLWIHKYGDKLFTLLTDDLIGSIYDSSNEGGQERSLGEGKGNVAPLRLTILLHAKRTKTMTQLTDSEIEGIARTQMEVLFPGINEYLEEVEVFTFRHAVAHWPIKLGRSRFDFLAHYLRTPFGQTGGSLGGADQCRTFIGGDMTYGSHSEGAALSALAIAEQIKKLMNV